VDLKSSYDNYKFNDYFKTDLPAHWLEKRLGYLAKEERAAFVDGPFGSDLKSNDYKDSGVPLIQLNNIRDSKHLMQNMKFVTEEKKQQLIRHLAIPGDVVIAKMADPVARSAVVADDFSEYVIVADCVKLTPNLDLIDLSYLVWAINCDYVRINAELVSTGTTRIRVNLGELKKLKIPYPPSNEQSAIANFLDHETAKIDTLIEKQQQLIKLLKEKRQAVISHAVTKGLNPSAPMRDSGVDWLGEVPEHWDVKQAKYVADITRGAILRPVDAPEYFDDEGEWAYLNISDATKCDKYLYKSKLYLSPLGSTKSARVYPDNVIITASATIGKAFINKVKVCVHDGFIPFCNLLVDKSYLYHYLSNPYLYAAMGKSNTQKNIYLDEVKNMVVTMPPDKEQLAIVEYIEKNSVSFDALIKKAEKAILLMQERRTALISAAVTGKIDVRLFNAEDGQGPATTKNKEVNP
jgi:type I restriction enzyme S subunit